MSRYEEFVLLSVLIALPAASLAQDRPALNTLSGVVVSKAEGKPLAGVPVVMVHPAKAGLTISWDGITASGEDNVAPESFASRNAKVTCDAISGPDGSFTLRSFCTPEAPWTVAAGTRAHGLFLRGNVIPNDYLDKPLRIEIEAPAYIRTAKLPSPPKAEFRARVAVAITDLARPATSRKEGQSDTPTSHVYVYAWPDNPEDSEWRLGPLPPGFTYRVTHTIWSPNLRYDITLFERTVRLDPGTSPLVSLTAESGASLRGRITDTKEGVLSDVNVLVRTRGESGIILGALSDADGRYEISHVPPGTHALELLRHARPSAPT